MNRYLCDFKTRSPLAILGSRFAHLGSFPNRGRVLVATVLVLLAAWPLSAMGESRSVDFATDILPILQTHCIACHHPGNRKGDVSLATAADLIDNEHLVVGDPKNSHLMELISAVDGQAPAMPRNGDPLDDDDVALIAAWISQGAAWPEDVVVREKPKADESWWSLQPLSSQPLSSPGDTASEGGKLETIDQFIDAKLAHEGFDRNGPADRVTLIRRATYDLIGLPPTPEEVDAFVRDTDPLAYEKLIDRLLDSPHYGKHWGRHWLDVVRFGESNGFERNVIINSLWPFRDYVIESLNNDKPMDQFIAQHIAGDVIGRDDPDLAVGSAFLVAGPYDDVGNQDAAAAAQIRANTIDEIIRATSEAFLGMTIGCARCHDHKFDPITQQDYYGLYSTFSGIRHGEVSLATAAANAQRGRQLEPLQAEKKKLQTEQTQLKGAIVKRAREKLDEYQSRWTRPRPDRTRTEERFEATDAKFVRLVCLAQDNNPNTAAGFTIDEFEVWSYPDAVNVALAKNGGKATGAARTIEDFPDAYGAHLAIDGQIGARFISTGNDLTIELAKPTKIERVVFSSARDEPQPDQRKFTFVAEYRIEVSEDGKTWRTVASGDDRRVVEHPAALQRRLLQLETSPDETKRLQNLNAQLKQVDQKIAAVGDVPKVWIGQRVPGDAKGPFHVFIGGDPQKKGPTVVPASLGVLGSDSSEDPQETQSQCAAYRLPEDAPEDQRRKALASWIVDPSNPLTPRVLANRLWHYHFGTGIVDTPSDFGYMGGRPTHPELLDFLARKLIENQWRLKPMHRMIVLSATYRQSSEYRPEPAAADADARWLWRFPPRRLSAEQVRDTMLHVAGKLQLDDDGGPGFRLYHFMQDNVCTYVPLDEHGPQTYRRAVYHQNARASVVDLLTEFDLPDCAFSIPRRSATTTPLQALTLMNHRFTLDMADALADRLKSDAGDDLNAQLTRAFMLCYSRQPSEDERAWCAQFIHKHDLPAFCRVLLNTSELVYVR